MNVHIQLHDCLKMSVDKHSPNIQSQRKEADVDVVSISRYIVYRHENESS